MSDNPVKWTAAGLTPAGNALQAALLGTGDGLTFTRAAAADAEGVERLDLTLQSPCTVDGPKCRVPVLLTNAGVETAFTMTELRFYVRRVTDGAPTGEEILYATVTDETGDPIPTAAQSPGFTIDWAFVFQYGNAGSVTVTLDPVGLVSIGMVGQPGGVAALGDNGAVPVSQGGTGEKTIQGTIDAFGIFLAISAAAAYDQEGSYAVGDYCTHGGKLHKCNTPIESGEAWNPAHWTETTVAAELESSMRSADIKLVDVSQMIAKSYFGVTPSSGAIGLPAWWPATINEFIRWCPNGSQYLFDIAANFANKRVAYRLFYNGDWIEFATATPPESVTIPLNDGYTGSMTVEKNQFGEILLSGLVKPVSGIVAGSTIATLPDGFLPKKTEVVTLTAYAGSDGGSFCTFCQLYQDGSITLSNEIPTNYKTGTNLVFNHTYQGAESDAKLLLRN